MKLQLSFTQSIVQCHKDKNKEYPVKSVTLNITYNEQYHYPEKVKYGASYYIRWVLKIHFPRFLI